MPEIVNPRARKQSTPFGNLKSALRKPPEKRASTDIMVRSLSRADSSLWRAVC